MLHASRRIAVFLLSGVDGGLSSGSITVDARSTSENDDNGSGEGGSGRGEGNDGGDDSGNGARRRYPPSRCLSRQRGRCASSSPQIVPIARAPTPGERSLSTVFGGQWDLR